MFEFVIRSVSGAIVAFESLKFPGHYLSVGKDGLVKLEQHSLESQNVRFTVRVSVSHLIANVVQCMAVHVVVLQAGCKICRGNYGCLVRLDTAVLYTLEYISAEIQWPL